jgi:hypothetical protein
MKQKVEEMESKERQLSEEIQAIIYKNTTNAVETQKDSMHVHQKAQQLESSL